MVQMLSTVGYTERKGGMEETLTCVRGPVNHMQIQRSVPDTRGSTFAGSALRSHQPEGLEAGLGRSSWSQIQTGKTQLISQGAPGMEWP